MDEEDTSATWPTDPTDFDRVGDDDLLDLGGLGREVAAEGPGGSGRHACDVLVEVLVVEGREVDRNLSGRRECIGPVLGLCPLLQALVAEDDGQHERGDHGQGQREPHAGRPEPTSRDRGRGGAGFGLRLVGGPVGRGERAGQGGGHGGPSFEFR